MTAKVKDQWAGLPEITSGSATVLSNEFALNPNAVNFVNLLLGWNDAFTHDNVALLTVYNSDKDIFHLPGI